MNTRNGLERSAVARAAFPPRDTSIGPVEPLFPYPREDMRS